MSEKRIDLLESAKSILAMYVQPTEKTDFDYQYSLLYAQTAALIDIAESLRSSKYSQVQPKGVTLSNCGLDQKKE